MKQRWQQWCAKVDALGQRERVVAFAGVAAVIVFAAWCFVLGPMFGKYEALRAQIAQAHNNLAGVDAEITQKLVAAQQDPDQANHDRLEQVQADTARLADSLRAMQKGLVPPDRMAPLLGTILRANGRLQLASMKTLPVAPVSDLAAAVAPEPAAKDARPAAGAGGALLYRHGVQVAVRGNYLDMLSYMSALEAMPTQLFWGRADLEVEQYPTSRLTLTLYTLSLDPTWMKL
jgi:MSHA biogenesis protein MshJ